MEIYFDEYYDHVLNKSRAVGAKAIVFDLIHDLTDRRGLKQEFNQIDDEIQDEIIGTWINIVNKNLDKYKESK